MDELIVSDTSCLIVLSKTGQLELLNALFSAVMVTHEVLIEFGEPLPDWISVQSVQDTNLQKMLETQLDIGEASSISLALQMPSRQILIDERKGRRIASEMGLKVLGTIMVLILAKEKCLIPSLSDALEQLTKVGFRLSDVLVKEVLNRYEPKAT
jgi:predicted nucleic acid-binding protein